ncbi:hypothetical protein GCM10023084_56020 [Streptomyces lacrimifluminis]|uniref:8-amino-7-oxononanoate synthase n=2 Tax=Streptomyces lacrimifluminis TaxID=1500077 RepID=A0A917KMZ1_9ACTN|nr:hypothetical protein GCM10012282_10590 [Streptomyces lacrimifluminis]
MGSDTPQLAELLGFCREFGAQLMVDVAHDFGAMGEHGGGQLEAHGVLRQVDFVVGPFSKTFATAGGFLATPSASAREFVRMFGGPQTFSSAITPVQTAVALAALGIVTSPEGARRRASVAAVATRLREGLTAHGLEVMGDVVCPVVLVLIGDTPTGRTASGLIARAGLIAHLVEQPALSPRTRPASACRPWWTTATPTSTPRSPSSTPAYGRPGWPPRPPAEPSLTPRGRARPSRRGSARPAGTGRLVPGT